MDVKTLAIEVAKLKLRISTLAAADGTSPAELEDLQQQLKDLEALVHELFGNIAARVQELEHRPAVVVHGGGAGGPGPAGPPGPVASSYFPGGW